jgi:hypothetical protein
MNKYMNSIKFVFWQNMSIFMFFLAVGLSALLISSPSILPCGKGLEAVIAIIIGYLGLLYNLINYKIAHDKFFKELFTEFNARFDNLNEALNEIIEGKTLVKIDGISKTHKAIIRDYLNLCAEEYLWYKKGRIEPAVWQAWSEGMRFYLNITNFKAVYHKQRDERTSYYGLIEELDKLGIGV